MDELFYPNNTGSRNF